MPGQMNQRHPFAVEHDAGPHGGHGRTAFPAVRRHVPEHVPGKLDGARGPARVLPASKPDGAVPGRLPDVVLNLECPADVRQSFKPCPQHVESRNLCIHVGPFGKEEPQARGVRVLRQNVT